MSAQTWSFCCFKYNSISTSGLCILYSNALKMVLTVHRTCFASGVVDGLLPKYTSTVIMYHALIKLCHVWLMLETMCLDIQGPHWGRICSKCWQIKQKCWISCWDWVSKFLTFCFYYGIKLLTIIVLFSNFLYLTSGADMQNWRCVEEVLCPFFHRKLNHIFRFWQIAMFCC